MALVYDHTNLFSNRMETNVVSKVIHSLPHYVSELRAGA